MRGFFYLNTDNVHAPANLSHSHNSASMYPSQLRGGSSQMLLLKWRYVNQGNLEITLTVTWVGLLGSWTGTQTETDRGLPAGFAELCCFFLLLFFFKWVRAISAFARYTVETTQKGHVTLATVWDRWVRLEPGDVANTVAHSVLYPADSQSGLKLF